MSQTGNTLSANSDHIQYFVSELDDLLQRREAINVAIKEAIDNDPGDELITQANITRIQLENAINTHINNQYKVESLEIFKAYRGYMFPSDSIDVDGISYNNHAYLNGVSPIELSDESLSYFEIKYEELKKNLINNQEFRESNPEWYYQDTITDELGAIALGTIVDTFLNEGAGKLVPGSVSLEQQMNLDVATYAMNDATKSIELYKQLYQEFDGQIGNLLIALTGNETRDDRLTELLTTYSYAPSDGQIAKVIASISDAPPDTDFSGYDSGLDSVVSWVSDKGTAVTVSPERIWMRDNSGVVSVNRFNQEIGEWQAQSFTPEQVQNEDINNPFDPQNDGVGLFNGENLNDSDFDSAWNDEDVKGLTWGIDTDNTTDSMVDPVTGIPKYLDPDSSNQNINERDWSNLSDRELNILANAGVRAGRQGLALINAIQSGEELSAVDAGINLALELDRALDVGGDGYISNTGSNVLGTASSAIRLASAIDNENWGRVVTSGYQLGDQLDIIDGRKYIGHPPKY